MRTSHPFRSSSARQGSQHEQVTEPVLFVEVDNCTEPADILAAKFEEYIRYFRARIKSSLGTEMPAWRAYYRPSGRDGHPPVLIVFNPGTRIGEQALPTGAPSATLPYLIHTVRGPRPTSRRTLIM